MSTIKNKSILPAFIILLFILITGDSNAQWITYNLPYNGIAYSIEFYNLNSGISCGHTFATFNGYIFYTTNSGNNWIPASYPAETRAIANIQYINANTVYACGAENVFANGQSRINNEFKSFPLSIREKFRRLGITEFQAGYKALFLKSTNGGVNWQKAGQFDTSKGYITDIHFFDANTGYALMDSGSYGKTRFYKTTNAGQNWQLIKYIDSSAVVDEMIFFDINTGFASGFNNGGKIYKTTNGGLNWSTKSISVPIDGITFFDANTGIAVGITEGAGRCNVYRTGDSGNNWDSLTSFQGGRLLSNLKSIQSTGIAFCAGNTVSPLKITTMKTSNYGENWVVKEFYPSKFIEGLVLINQNTFFISGGDFSSSAIILKSTNGGNVFVNQISSEIPVKYLLEQNYPNPFNSSTNIKFNMPKAGKIKITVFNLLGKEIAVLVNEELQAGTYQVQFDAANLSSGMYIYKMETGGYTETKKMLILK